MISYWQKNAIEQKFDVAIIGAGFTGLATAMFLKEKNPKLNIGVFEKKLAHSAASVRNAGFACYGSPSEVLADIHSKGEQQAIDLLLDRWNGIQYIKNEFGEQIKIDNSGGTEIFTKNESILFEKTKDELVYLNEVIKYKLNFEPYYFDENPKHFKSKVHSIRIKAEFGVNPLELWQALYLKVLNTGVQVFDNCDVKTDDQNTFFVNDIQDYKIKANNFVIAVNGLDTKLLDNKVKPARAQVFITKPLKGLADVVNGNYHVNEGYYYFRMVNNCLLFGGARHIDKQTEQTDKFELNTLIQQHIFDFVNTHICNLKSDDIAHKWVGIMGFSNDGIPKIKQINDATKQIAGMGGMGVALSFSLAKKYAEQF